MTLDELRRLALPPAVPFTLDLGAAEPVSSPSASTPSESIQAESTGGAAGDGRALEVTAVLRWLPGRRLAAAAEWNGRRVFLKCLFGGHRAWRQAERELRGGRFIVAAGLRTPACVIDRVQVGGRVLGFEWLADARPVDLEHPLEQQAMIEALRVLDRSGYRHADPHAGNFLRVDVAPKSERSDDADSVVTFNPGPSSDRVDAQKLAAGDLVLIDAGSVRRRFWPRSFARDRARVLAQRPIAAALRSASAADTPAIDAAEARARRQRVRRLLRKTLRTATGFQHLEQPGVRIHVVREPTTEGWIPAVPAWLIEDPEQAMASGVVIKAGRTATVVRIPGPPDLIIKRYNNKSAWHALRRTLAPQSRARSAWLNGHRLAALGIAAARPLALIETRRHGLRGPAYLIMADAGQDDLAACVARDQVSPALAERVAQLLASLAAADLAHRDLKASNVLIDEDGAPCLIDLDAMRERRGGDPRDVARLLANWAAQPLNESIQRLRAVLVSTGSTLPAAGS